MTHASSLRDSDNNTTTYVSNEKFSDIQKQDVEQASDVFHNIDEKKVLRKMDLRLLPMLSILYLLCFLDRGNIGNAKIEGLPEELGLVGPQYNLCLTVFFFTYAAFEVPSNLLLKRLRPSIWLPSIMVAWGVVMTLMGVVQNYAGLLTARIFLGVAEAGLYPGVAFYITMWYCRHEAQYRQALFFSSASIAGAFSGLLAYAIAKMNGVGGYSGWRWIFILEGLATVVVGFISFFVIHDFPETASFLTKDEREWVVARLRNQNTDSRGRQLVDEETFSWKYVRDAFTDWQVYLALIMYWGIVCPLYGISFFLPTIIKDLGYSSSTAQLLTLPIYITAAIVSVIAALFSDKAGQRSPFILGFFLCIIAGFIICIVSSGRGVPGVVYFGTFLAVVGIYPAFPGNVTWLSNNLAGGYKRAAGMAIHIGIGNLGGAMASNFYRTQDAPKYILGHALELGFAVAGTLAVLILRFSYQRVNFRREEALANEDSTTGPSVATSSERGDRSLTFRYML
ncbi:MFS nicotinic acid transporter Tna1 [Talaromyces proteolyticus]|uniref:MFS nicotinic acid transporter Tna1 n=1 Tax=Talaromyces proteolyticus TaxID=1131652 RepID=A0AAD4Q4I6_9EURO|nr:MFS nicotinic acid transporter Tna1 [Talaromyces proteolyticus]KAH8703055.1 MFS nicotinic acid transporter Tna1 [Talaromyces proteolyticus]